MRDNKTPNEGNKSLLPLTFQQSFLLDFILFLTLITNSNFKLMFFPLFADQKSQLQHFVLQYALQKSLRLAKWLHIFFIWLDGREKEKNIFNVIENVRKKRLPNLHFILFASSTHSVSVCPSREVSHGFSTENKTLLLYHLHDGKKNRKKTFFMLPSAERYWLLFFSSLHEYFMRQRD